MWNEIARHFKPHRGGWPNMTLTKYLTANKFGLWIDLRSMADTTMHGNGQRMVNTQDGVQLEIDRKASGSGTTNCHIFTISDAQMNIMVSSWNRLITKHISKYNTWLKPTRSTSTQNPRHPQTPE